MSWLTNPYLSSSTRAALSNYGLDINSDMIERPSFGTANTFDRQPSFGFGSGPSSFERPYGGGPSSFERTYGPSSFDRSLFANTYDNQRPSYTSFLDNEQRPAYVPSYRPGLTNHVAYSSSSSGYRPLNDYDFYKPVSRQALPTSSSHHRHYSEPSLDILELQMNEFIGSRHHNPHNAFSPLNAYRPASFRHYPDVATSKYSTDEQLAEIGFGVGTFEENRRTPYGIYNPSNDPTLKKLDIDTDFDDNNNANNNNNNDSGPENLTRLGDESESRRGYDPPQPNEASRQNKRMSIVPNPRNQSLGQVTAVQFTPPQGGQRASFQQQGGQQQQRQSFAQGPPQGAQQQQRQSVAPQGPPQGGQRQSLAQGPPPGGQQRQSVAPNGPPQGGQRQSLAQGPPPGGQQRQSVAPNGPPQGGQRQSLAQGAARPSVPNKNTQLPALGQNKPSRKK